MNMGQPLGRWSTKKRYRPILQSSEFSNRFFRNFRTLFADQLKPEFSCFRIEPSWGLPREAVRSVSHLVLAPGKLMGIQPQNSNRKERTGGLQPDSLRLGVLGQPDFNPTRHSCPARRVVTNSAPIPPLAGPENFQCRAVFTQF